jgi:hypothetical protein
MISGKRALHDDGESGRAQALSPRGGGNGFGSAAGRRHGSAGAPLGAIAAHLQRLTLAKAELMGTYQR